MRSGVGSHYLDVCRGARGPGSEEAAEFASGVQSVLEGRSDLFEMEYPCHSPTQNRWFVGRVTPLQAEQRGAVSETPIKDGEIQFNLTASFGVTELGPKDQDIDAALARADLALYAAKHSGWNCVMRFSALPQSPGLR